MAASTVRLHYNLVPQSALMLCGLEIAWPAQKSTNYHPKLPQMLTDFQNSFADRVTGKSATKESYLNIPPKINKLYHPKLRQMLTDFPNFQNSTF